ncbi:hypothetical protein FRX31_028275 [Thalictrum thalictroides]|uniref:Uncharacterized protein n=1 Tax=Thalictrum thalictroides TaxID=46969 RepID=A0A7J6VAM7_THATH|nr:hypothetical protein FRX31_028275 [Thalictrum thalictroides]
MDFPKKDLRLHLEWINGKWVSVSQKQEAAVEAQNQGSVQSHNPTDKPAHNTNTITQQTPTAAVDDLWQNILSSQNMSEPKDIESTSTDSSCDPVCSDQEKIEQSKSKNDNEVLQPFEKGRERQETETPLSTRVCLARTPIGNPIDVEAQCVLSFPTKKRGRSKSQSRKAKSRSVSKIIGCPKAHVQCQKKQHVVLPTQQMKGPSAIELEGIGGVSNQNQNVVKRKRGRPKGSGKTCGRRDLDSEDEGRRFPKKGPENDPTSKEMTSVQTESTQLPSYVLEEHQVPPKILETSDSSRVKDNGGTEDEASTNIQTMSLIVEEHQPLSLCIEKSNPTISGGTELEAANDALTTVQTNHVQLLNPTMADQQTLSPCLENSNPPTLGTADNQLMLNEATTLTGTSMESLQYNQSSNEVESPYSLKAKGDDIYQSFVDVTVNTYSSPMQEDKGQKPLNNESLPFIKSSNMWENMESMEVFKLIPQHPHFRPLEKLNEELREGAAFGNMCSFVSLMERTCEAQLDDPRSKFENKLKALTDLEDHGFTVQPIRSKLEAMLRIIDRYSQFNNESKAPETELFDEKRQYDEILESIARLNMQLQALLMEKDKKASKVAELQKMTDEFKEKFQRACLDFDTVRAAPWK